MTLQSTSLRHTQTAEKPEVKEFLNRELSWLEFNRRVLHEALDDRTPLLERVGFLSIFTSNLDEFYQKRVGGLKRQIATGVMGRSPDGMGPADQLTAIRSYVLEMIEVQANCYTQVIRPALADNGIHLLSWDQITKEEQGLLRQYFHANLFPVLTPLTVDPGHPFPFISNLSMSLGVWLRHPEDAGDSMALAGDGPVQFARVKVPHILPRWIRLGKTIDDSPGGGQGRFISLQQVICYNLGDLFDGMHIEAVMPFRITRNADVERDEEDAEDLLEMIEQELRDRRFAPVVRLEVGKDPDPRMIQLLKQELELEDSDIYCMPDQLDFTDLQAIYSLNLPELKHRSWIPVTPSRLADDEADIFGVIRAGDVLVHHPYESYSASVERFIRAAASDPKVVAIKQTLYRTSADSPFIPELIRAAERGKQVVCLVELQARFDEERNIGVAQQLEKAGVHVVYGIVGLKTHTKTALVVRHESEGMRVYAHIGTGNYNSKTAQLYTDLGLFTCNRQLTDELVELFHYLTGRRAKHHMEHLLVAPINMRKQFVQMIQREIEHAQAWQERGADPDDPDRPRIIAKMNSLEDPDICRKLYHASQAGVKIQLIVRGFCCIRPGVPGMSENISVSSVIGRFLEHSRVYRFYNGGQVEYYIGSADWMYRNLNNRVECITPVTEPSFQQRLEQVLQVMLTDQRQAWDMLPDGQYMQRQPVDPDSDSALGTHIQLMRIARREGQRPGAQQEQ